MRSCGALTWVAAAGLASAACSRTEPQAASGRAVGPPFPGCTLRLIGPHFEPTGLVFLPDYRWAVGGVRLPSSAVDEQEREQKPEAELELELTLMVFDAGLERVEVASQLRPAGWSAYTVAARAGRPVLLARRGPVGEWLGLDQQGGLAPVGPPLPSFPEGEYHPGSPRPADLAFDGEGHLSWAATQTACCEEPTTTTLHRYTPAEQVTSFEADYDAIAPLGRDLAVVFHRGRSAQLTVVRGGEIARSVPIDHAFLVSRLATSASGAVLAVGRPLTVRSPEIGQLAVMTPEGRAIDLRARPGPGCPNDEPRKSGWETAVERPDGGYVAAGWARCLPGGRDEALAWWAGLSNDGAVEWERFLSLRATYEPMEGQVIEHLAVAPDGRLGALGYFALGPCDQHGHCAYWSTFVMVVDPEAACLESGDLRIIADGVTPRAR